MKKTRILLILVVIAFLVGGGIGFYLYNKPPLKTENQKAVTKIDAGSLYSEYELDEDEANNRYLGEIIEVEGNIAGITINESNVPVLQLNNELFGVSCSFDKSHFKRNNKKINSLSKGDHVTLKCQCDGMLTDVVLTRCILITSKK